MRPAAAGAAVACEWFQPKTAQFGQPFQSGRRRQEGRTRAAMIHQHATRDRESRLVR